MADSSPAPSGRARGKLWGLIAIAAALGLLLPLLWSRPDAPGRPSWLETWYADPGYQFLVPVVREVKPEYLAGRSPAEVGLALLQQAPSGLVSVLPVGTETRLLPGAGSEATVEVRLPRIVGSGEERLIIGAVVRTVLGTPGFERVRVRLAGRANQPLPSLHEDLGRSFGATSPEVRNSWDGQPGPRITAWFRLKGTEYLVPLDMASPLAEEPIQGTLQALMSPPPGGTAVLEAAVPSGAGLKFVGSPASGSYLVEWTNPDLPPDAWDKARLVSVTVLSLTEGGQVRSVEFRSPAGQISRKIPSYRLTRPITRDDVRQAIKVPLPPG